MEETLKKSLEEILKYVQQGAEFAKEQAPLVAQEYLQYELIINSIWAIFFALSLALPIYCWIKTVKYWKSDEPDENCVIWGTVGTGLLSLALTAEFVSFLTTIIQIQVAPRLYILKGIKGFL